MSTYFHGSATEELNAIRAERDRLRAQLDAKIRAFARISTLIEELAKLSPAIADVRDYLRCGQ